MPKVSWDGKSENMGCHVKEHRLRRGWTQAVLSKKSGVSLRSVKNVESGAIATMTTIGKLADALEVDIADIIEEFPKPSKSIVNLPRFLLQQAFPVALDPNLDQLVREGAFADMNRDYDVAIAKFQSADELDHTLETQAQIIVKWATSIDNSGNSEEAIRELQPLLVNAKFRELRPQITNWVRYHIAIAKRRIYEKRGNERQQELHAAETTFKDLTKVGDAAQRVAAIHQLGVIYWIRSLQNNSPDDRHKAENFFTKASQEWHATGNFREGYALRRLADIAEERRDFHKAHGLLLDALEIFTRFEAEGYRRETRTRLHDLLQKILRLTAQ